MPKYLQINLNCCEAAQALLHQVAAEESVDFILASEFHRTEGPNWHPDATGKAAVVNVKKARLDNEGMGEAGFRWVSAHGLRLYSCYWSPNTTIGEFTDFISRLEVSIRSEATEVILTGDFNAKHSDWGCPTNDKRGEVLIAMVNTLGMVICNKDRASTFKKGTIIDLTIATPQTAGKMQEWKVMDEETLSDHFYILFETKQATQDSEPRKVLKIDPRKLEALLSSDRWSTALSCLDADESARTLTESITKCHSSPRGGQRTRKSVHWWSPDISALRATANHLRRVFERKRKRHGAAASAAEETDAKEARRKLVVRIKQAKEAAWKNLCDLVQKDTWGLPYKLVMEKLTRPPPRSQT